MCGSDTALLRKLAVTMADKLDEHNERVLADGAT
jgi:hypothetical protein